MMRNIWLLLIALFSFAEPALSQIYSFKTYSAADGLSQDFIYSLAQSSRGSLWIGTGEGLYRYDGKNFKAFGKKEGLAENFVTSSICDNQENLWFGHYNGGISFFNGHIFSPLNHNNLITSPVNCFLSQDGFIWAGTQSDGIIRINEDFSVDSFPELKNLGNIYALEQVDEKILAATSENLYLLDFSSGSPGIKPLFGQTTSVQCLQKTSGGSVLLGTRDNGVYTLEHGKLEKLSLPKLPEDQINIIYSEPNGTIWVSSFGNGVFRYIKNDSAFVLNGEFSSRSGLPSDYIKSFIIDREGIVWFGTYGEGVSKLLSPMFTILTKKEGAPGEVIKNIFTDENTLYFVSDSAISYTRNNKWSAVPVNISDKITAATLLESGIYLIGTESKGVFKYNSVTGKTSAWPIAENRLARRIKDVRKDSKGNIWVATEDGAYLYEKKKDRFTRYGMDQGVAHNNISCIYEDSNGIIWFGTHGGGLSGLKNGKIITIPAPGKTGLDIYCFTEDEAGNLWIGTYGQGIYKVTNDKFELYLDKSAGLASNYCYSIISDKNNNIWIAHKNSLSRYEQQKNKVVVENENLVLSDFDFQNLAAGKDEEGNLFFGTNTGILRYNFSATPPLALPPILNISGILLNFQEVDWTNYSDTVYSLAKIPFDLQLDYDKNHLTFRITAVSLSSGPDKIQYQYMLEGYESSWSLVTNEAFITYPNLPPGTYSFKVRAKAGDSEWGEINRPYTFTITPPFWQTWWFIVFSSASMIVLVIYIIMARTEKLREQREKLRRDKQRLEQEVSERIKAQKQQKIVEEKLIQTNQELNNFIYRSSHDLRGPISTVKGLTQLGLMEMKDPQAQKFFNLILDRTHILDSVLKNLIGIVEVIEGDINLAKIDFEELTENLLKDLNQDKILKDIKITVVNKLGDTSFYNDNKLIYTIFRNILDNSIKYRKTNSDKSFAEVTITGIEKGINITFIDNGLGISKQVQPKIFDMFYRGSDESKGSGLGLYMVKKIVEKLAGNINLTSSENNGTDIEIFLPNLKENIHLVDFS